MCRGHRKGITHQNFQSLLFLSRVDSINHAETTHSILGHCNERIQLCIFCQYLPSRRPKYTQTLIFDNYITFLWILRHRLTKVLIKNQLHTLLALVPWWLSPFLKHSVDLGSITLNFLSLLVVANKDPFLIYMNPLLLKNYAYIHLCVEIILNNIIIGQFWA